MANTLFAKFACCPNGRFVSFSNDCVNFLDDDKLVRQNECPSNVHYQDSTSLLSLFISKALFLY